MVSKTLFSKKSDEWSTPQDFIFIRGRLKFGGSNNSAPFPSMIIVFKKF